MRLISNGHTFIFHLLIHWIYIILSFLLLAAPEVLKSKGYNRSLDMWSVGVIIYVRLVVFSTVFFIFFKKILEYISPFYGATDIRVLDFWWHLLWTSKPGWISHLHASLPGCNGFLRFIWVDTYWLLDGQHGNWAFLSTYLHTYMQTFMGL